MAQWGSSDASSNAVLWAPTSVKLAPTTTNRDSLYGNTTADAFITGQRVGMFAVDKTEEAVGNGPIVTTTVTFAGSGYTANATVTVTGDGADGAVNAHANSTGKIDLVKIENAGSGYENNATLVIAAPSAITFNANTALFEDAAFNANTGVNGTTEYITTTSAHGFTNGDRVKYIVASGNTAIGGLTNATSYYVISANTTAFKLSTSSGGTAVDVTPTATSETGHTLRRQDFIEISSNVLQNGDQVTYKTAAGNTVITGLANNTSYYVVGANATGVYLSTANGGSRISLSTPGLSETGHSFTGQTATAVATVGGAANKGIPHTGWVLRTEGSGGRAGRVQYEVLVAGGIVTDGSDDSVLPDA